MWFCFKALAQARRHPRRLIQNVTRGGSIAVDGSIARSIAGIGCGFHTRIDRCVGGTHIGAVDGRVENAAAAHAARAARASAALSRTALARATTAGRRSAARSAGSCRSSGPARSGSGRARSNGRGARRFGHDAVSGRLGLRVQRSRTSASLGRGIGGRLVGWAGRARDLPSTERHGCNEQTPSRARHGFGSSMSQATADTRRRALPAGQARGHGTL